MATPEEPELCFSELVNTSCRKRSHPRSATVLIYTLVSSVSLLTVVLNLLVIASISHFRHSSDDMWLCTDLMTYVTCKAFVADALTSAAGSLYIYKLHMMCCQLCFALMKRLLMVITLSLFVMFSPSRQLHTPTNLLLLSLAVSDFLVGLLVMPFQILLTEPCWFLGDLLCSLYYVLPYITVNASVGNMVLISADRYVAICDPLRYSTKVTQMRVKLCVLLCWIYCVFYSLMILYDDLRQPGRYNSCYGECVININGAIDLVVSFIVPITAIVLLYVRVFVVAVSQARAMRSHIAAVTLQRSGTVTVKRSELKAAKTLGVVVTVFIVCYCPPYSVCLSGYDLTISSSTSNFIVFLLFSNSCLNPVIYAFLYPWFRKCVKLIVTLQVLQPHSSEARVL